MANIQPDKKLAAVCGLFCPSCTLYIASSEDPERLQRLAQRLNQSPEEARCEGCRSQKRTGYCESCKMSACAVEKGIEFCGECDEYPCEEMKRFQELYAHRIELWESQERIRSAGFERWYEEMSTRFSCPECGAINSAYDVQCRQCQNEPSCEYVKVNKEEIGRRNSVRTLR